MSNKEKIIQWLENNGINNYTINEDLTVDIKGNVKLTKTNAKEIPFKFGIVYGNFETDGVALNHLPKEIKGFFMMGFDNEEPKVKIKHKL